jgi:small subunit ribosomal protein S1
MSGFIRKGDLSRERSGQRVERFAAGEKIDAKVMQVDTASRKLTLSVKALEAAQEKKAMKEYGSSDSGASLGDILGAAFKDKLDSEPEEALAKKAPAKKAPAKKAPAKKAPPE